MQTNQSDVLKESKRKSTQMELQIRQTQEKKQKIRNWKVVWCFFIVYPGDPGQKYSWYYTQKTWVDRLYLNTNIRYISAQ